MAGTSSDTLTIITCDGSFTHTGDPVFGGEYNKRESELTPEFERTIAFVRGGLKYQVHPSQWNEVQKADSGAKLIQ
jgi:hypothetical protein